MKKTKTPISEILKQNFNKRKRSSPGFSARAMAGKLGVSQAYVSQILNGVRTLPPEMLDSFCELLDIDAERKELLSIAILEKQGWSKKPQKSLRHSDISAKAHTADWVTAPPKDLSLLDDWHSLALLEATQLDDYDGSVEFLQRRLGLNRAQIDSLVRNLTAGGFLEMVDGKMVKKNQLLEMQSGKNKKNIANYHKAVMKKAQATMDESSSDEDISRRLITSGVFTCSREQVDYLRAKLAEVLREIIVESSHGKAEEVYQLGIQLFPITKK
ncbi:MAG TPA: TIGR02147 family protein [Pseudobdellovibrionaceae bacterium]|nr:TIGR02147 family protein [Pseudobdellovibrionaceae bacterium]